MKRNIVYKVHSTAPPMKCGIASFTSREMSEAVKQSRVGGVIWDAHYRNEATDLPVERGAIKYTTDLTSDNIDVQRKAQETVRNAEYARSMGMELADYFGHEYGTFRDGKGRDILVPMMRASKRNGVITIFHPHTILEDPEKYGDDYRAIMSDAVQEADLILAMTPSAIDMLEGIYHAPRENIMYNPHGVDVFSAGLTRPELKNRYFGRSDFDLAFSGGFFSEGKRIHESIEAFAKAGKPDDKYLVLGLHKDKKHVEMCYGVAEKLGMNPISIGNGADGRGLEQLSKHDLSGHKVIFLDAYTSVKESSDAKKMADKVIVVNDSASQISSGEIVSALSANRVTLSYSSPIAEDLAKEGAGFSVEHGNVEDLASSIRFFDDKADKRRLELSSGIVSTRFHWEKTVRDFVDATAVIVDSRETERLENMISNPNNL